MNSTPNIYIYLSDKQKISVAERDSVHQPKIPRLPLSSARQIKPGARTLAKAAFLTKLIELKNIFCMSVDIGNRLSLFGFLLFDHRQMKGNGGRLDFSGKPIQRCCGQIAPLNTRIEAYKRDFPIRLFTTY